MRFDKIVLTTALFAASVAFDRGVSSQTASAQPQIVLSSIPVPSVPRAETSVGAAVSPMRKEQKAPFTGVLFSPVAVATLISTFDLWPQRVKIEVERAMQVCTAESEKKLADQTATSEYNNSVNIARIVSLNADNARLESDLRSKESAWSSGTWFGLGVLGGVAFTITTVYVVNKTQK